jgi:nicotinamidase-related amidase
MNFLEVTDEIEQDVAHRPQIFWPVHCVQGTRGAEFHPHLDASSIARDFRKGADPSVDSYSGSSIMGTATQRA